MIHAFLMIGQSNMAGRGLPQEVDPICDPRIKVLRNGRWWPMYTPVNCDRVTAGISLAESFAAAYAADHNVDVGLIPCADGGTCLDQWQEGGLLFDHALYQCTLASRTATIAGVLWHQGEADCQEDRWPMYEHKCTAILRAFREKLKLGDVPFLVGGLGDYLAEYTNAAIAKNYRHINTALQAMADKDPMMAYVGARGLTSNPDHLHFSAAGLREFGLRYYDAFCLLERKDKVFLEKPAADLAIRSSMEFL